MAELSLFWAGNTVGDAATVTDDVFSDFLSNFLTYDRTIQGVLDTGRSGFTGGLIVTGGAGSVSVATGIALVDGKPYSNSAAVSVAIPTPAALTRIDRIVLRKDFVAQTVRITRIAGTEGGAAPGITQNDGVTWDIKLAQVSITTGAVITVTNEAQAIRNPGGPGYQAATLPTTDSTHTAGAWNSLGAGVSMTLGPGDWLIQGAIRIKCQGSSGTRFARIYNVTASTALVVGGQYAVLTEDATIVAIARIITLTVTTAVELQFYALSTTDDVYGDNASDGPSTSMVALRVV